jgi:hypothetical protein
MTGEQIRISAKDLGAVAMPTFCPKCFWIKLRMGRKLPYQILPGISSSIDAYTKRIVHSWFARHHSAPQWLSDLGELTGFIPPPHWNKFNFVTKLPTSC